MNIVGEIDSVQAATLAGSNDFQEFVIAACHIGITLRIFHNLPIVKHCIASPSMNVRQLGMALW